MKWVAGEYGSYKRQTAKYFGFSQLFFLCVISLTLALPEDLGEKYPLNLMVECERGK